MTKMIDILYVEDNQDHILFVTKALHKINPDINVIAVDNGRDALALLQKYGQGERVVPRLILLDLNMPGFSGLDILREIKADEHLKLIPITMFSTSDNVEDVKRSVTLGANAYVVKPNGFQKLTECLNHICCFWLGENYHVAPR